MSEAKADADTGREKTTVNIRMLESFLEDVDGTWQAYYFNSRSEYICAVLRDTLTHLDFNRTDLKAMLASEIDTQAGRTHASDERTTNDPDPDIDP